MGTMLTVEEFAQRLKVSPHTVRDWLREGKVQGRKLGRLWRIPEDEVEKVFASVSEMEEGSEQ